MTKLEEKMEEIYKSDIKLFNRTFHKFLNCQDPDKLKNDFEFLDGLLKDIYQYRLRIARANENKSV